MPVADPADHAARPGRHPGRRQGRLRRRRDRRARSRPPPTRPNAGSRARYPEIRYVFLDPTAAATGAAQATATRGRGPIASPPMVRWRSGTVTAVRRRWHGAVELDVADRRRPGAGAGLPGSSSVSPQVGDRVLLNVGALVMGLGTGGYALVVALPDRLPADPPTPAPPRRRPPGQGPLHPAAADPARRRRGGLAAPRDVLAAADDLGGMPVVTADLHSALPGDRSPGSTPTPRTPGSRT